MTIHNFALPALLETDLTNGGRKLSEKESFRLKSMMTRIDSPRPRFWGRDQIISQHRLWGSSEAASYFGAESTEFFPGRIDSNLILIIGEADEDSPIALDYRTDKPRIVYLGGNGPRTFWIELASSYEELMDAFRNGEG